MSESRKIRYLPPRWTWRFFPKKTQRALALQSVRVNMLFFGYDLSDVTDEEIEERTVQLARMISRAMPTVQEAAEAMKTFARAAGRAGLTRADILPGPGGGPQSDEPLA